MHSFIIRSNFFKLFRFLIRSNLKVVSLSQTFLFPKLETKKLNEWELKHFEKNGTNEKMK